MTSDKQRDAADFSRGRDAGGTDLVIPAGFADDDLAALTRAVSVLEGSSLATRLNAVLGRQIDLATQMVPAPILDTVNRATLAALRFSLRTAVRTLQGTSADAPPRPRLHMMAAALSGAAGGAFGLSALPLELPVSTSIMLRSIAAIARAEGEDLEQGEALLACLEVFALGSGSDSGLAGESSYLAVRSVLAKSVTEAARFVLQRGLTDEATPVLVRLLSQIAARFGVAVGQKSLAQAVPVIGALTGAALNAAFADHFQSVATAHFTVRRLERRYGTAAVQALYADLRARRDPEPAPSRSAVARSHVSAER